MLLNLNIKNYITHDKSKPSLLRSLIASIYWNMHPKRKSIWTFPEKGSYRIIDRGKGLRFYTDSLRNAQAQARNTEKDFSIPEPYERYYEVRKGDVVLDVGGNIGKTAVTFARKAGTDGKVIVLEPDSDIAKALRKNIGEKLDINNVRVLEVGAWNKKGKIELEEKKCKMNTIDNIVDDLRIEKIDFLKMDIEGAELEALEGMKETLKKIDNLVIASYHIRNGEPTAERVKKFLEKHSFEVRMTDYNFVYKWRKNQNY